MSLRDRIRNPDRRTESVPVPGERRTDERREPFVAPWRRRSLAQADGQRFVAVHDTTDAAA